jgi:spore coat protein U-like protein
MRRAGQRIFFAGLLLSIGSVATAADAATQSTAQSSVVLASPLSLVKTQDLSFGNIAERSPAGNVTVNPDTGARTSTGPTLLGGIVTPASFVGVSSGLNLVIIHLPAAPVKLKRQGGTETVSVTSFALQGGQLRLLLSKQPFTFNIGGTLAIPANQRAGTYTGTFNVTVDYF